MSFTQLRVTSSATLLASPIRVADLVRAAKADGYDAMALTDVNVVYNLVAFYDAAQKAGIKPLLGMQLVIDEDNVVLIAENYAGYQQLQQISTAVQFGHTRLAELPSFTGLAVITTETGAAYQAFASGDGNAAATAVERLLAKQPASMNIGLPGVQGDVTLLEFAELHHWQPVILGDVRALSSADTEALRVLTAVATDKKLSQMDTDSPEYVLPDKELYLGVLRAAGLDVAIAGTAALVERCNVTIPLREPELPQFPLPEGLTTSEFLQQKAQAGLTALLQGVVPDSYQERLAYELQVIDQMGFADYFLIVQDIVHAAQSMGVMTGPGRGSAAGSLVAYSLGITLVDPLKYGLLFERFLNPNRGQMPDIDIDVQDNRRSDVLAYVQKRYGSAHTAQIMATSTFGPKQAVRDTAKVMGMASYAIDHLAEEMPGNVDTIADALAGSQRLRDLQRDDAQVGNVLRVASQIVGLPRTVTTHAAGVVLSAANLMDVVALQESGVGIGVQTQVTKEYVERIGLLKIDILGLRTLSLLTSMQGFVQRQFDSDFSLQAIPLTDAPTLALFAAGNTTGIFQFESRPMRSVLRKVQPMSFEDVVATGALYRPGPMQFIDEFADRMHGRKPVEYVTPLLQPILQSTYGIIVYQEQVMQVANQVGGMSLAAADDLRRAMSKKKQSAIDAGLTTFVRGAAQNGVQAEDARTIYAAIERFAGYGFNRSHAVAYGLLAFWLAYIKRHYPAAFFTTQLNANFGNQAKTQVFINEAKDAGVQILPPDINHSVKGYRIWHGNIRVGLNAIHGLRRDVIDAVLATRGDEPVTSLPELFLKLDPSVRNETAMLPLVKAGTFDAIDSDRANLIAGLPGMLEAVNLAGTDVALLKAVWPRKGNEQPLTASDRDAMTAEQLGYFLQGHPVDRFAILGGFYPITPISNQAKQSQIVAVATEVRVITTKKGTKMAFMTVQDASGSAEVTVFPKEYLQSPELKVGTVYWLRVRQDRESTATEQRLLAARIQTAVKMVEQLPEVLFLNLGAKTDVNMKKDVFRVLINNPGRTRVNVTSDGKTVLLDARYAVNASADMRGILVDMLGENAVAIHKPVLE